MALLHEKSPVPHPSAEAEPTSLRSQKVTKEVTTSSVLHLAKMVLSPKWVRLSGSVKMSLKNHHVALVWVWFCYFEVFYGSIYIEVLV